MIGVSLRGLFINEFQFTFRLSAGIVAADVGKAVALVPGTANTVRLAADNDIIVGRLESVENRTVEGILVGTVSLKGGLDLPKGSGVTVAVGDYLVGAGAGLVKPAAKPVQRQAFNGTGAVTQFVLNRVVTDVGDILVYVGGVLQHTTTYSLATASGITTLTMNTAPASGTNNVVVVHAAAAPHWTSVQAVEVPSTTSVIAVFG